MKNLKPIQAATKSMDPKRHNQSTWDAIAEQNDRWFQAVTSEELQAARDGVWRINVTAQKAVPREWLLPLKDRDVLCLAGAGGKQAPILAALGARVTVFDISHKQLERDRKVAQQEGLDLETIQGDMSNLSELANGSFDLIVNPCSVVYCPDPMPVWREAFRVLRSQGQLVSGLINPVNYLFDELERDQGNLVPRHKIPYSDLDLGEAERTSLWGADKPVDFGHSLSTIIGGLISVGFQLTGFFEDRWFGDDVLSEHLDVFLGVKMSKP